jgi:hypothetical protein
VPPAAELPQHSPRLCFIGRLPQHLCRAHHDRVSGENEARPAAGYVAGLGERRFPDEAGIATAPMPGDIVFGFRRDDPKGNAGASQQGSPTRGP